MAEVTEETDQQPDVEAEGNVLSAHREKYSRALLSGVLTLVLSILGSSVLSIPYAWSRLGILGGLITQIIVACCNTLASVLLLRTASAVKRSTYEGTAEAVGGRAWKIITQVSLVILLFGTIVGDFALLGSTAQLAVHDLSTVKPSWLDDDGRTIMILLVLLVVLPLCCLRRMRNLEVASTAGLLVIAAFFVIMVYEASVSGFPAIRSGELPLWKLRVTSDLPEAMAVMGFAFYIAPMLLPLRSEMPSGKTGDRLMTNATIIVILVVAQTIYGLLGAFGAAKHGLSTNGNVMVNRWLPPKAQGALELVMACYLAISIPPISLSLRSTLTCLLAGENAVYEPTRHYLVTSIPLFAGLAIALFFPQASEKVFAITGATGVMLICYLLPVVLHLMLRKQQQRRRKDEQSNGGALLSAEQHEMPQSRWSIVKEVVLPVLLAVIGVSISIAALVIAICKMKRGRGS